MLDSGIAKMGLFSFVLLLAFTGLLSIMPSQLVYGYTYGNQAEKIPDIWNGIQIGGYNFTDYWEGNITLTDFIQYDFDIGGRNLRFTISCANIPVYIRQFKIAHRYGFGLLWQENMDWYNADNEYIGAIVSYTNLNDDFDEFGNLEYEVICLGLGSGSTYFKIISLLSFNITTYETPEEAWNNDDLDILFGINAENTNYQQDIWYLISNLMMFNTLYVFGSTDVVAIALNGILAGFIYANIIIFATAVILEVLPF